MAKLEKHLIQFFERCKIPLLGDCLIFLVHFLVVDLRPWRKGVPLLGVNVYVCVRACVISLEIRSYFHCAETR